MILGSGLLTSSWPKASDWLIRDDFTDTVAAGSVDGTAATPGPGTRAVTDTGLIVSINSGALINSGASIDAKDPSVRFGAINRSSGVALITAVKQLSSPGSPAVNPAVLFANNSDPLWTQGHGVVFWLDQLYIVNVGSSVAFPTGGTYTKELWKKVAIVLRSAGAFVVDVSDKKLLWVYAVGNDATMYPAPLVSLATGRNPADLDYLRVVQLPAPFDSDTGLATDEHSGSVAAGTTFTHEADCVMEFTVDTLPSAANGIRVKIRSEDTDNYWLVYINQTGGFYLYESIDGSLTARGAAVAVVSSGHRIVIIAEGSTIRGYSNNTLRWTYGSATNFATETAGELNAVTGGVVSDLITWPRTLSGTAASILDKVSA